jgi:hypothetical protein
MKKIYFLHGASALTLAFFTILFFGSATSKKATTPLAPFTFDYSPPSSSLAGTAKFTIALVYPSYTGNFAYAMQSPFKEFRQSMGNDINELLIARGFSLKGPFETWDNMLYNDKQQSDVAITVEIDMNIQQTSGGWKYHQDVVIAANSYNSYNATLNFNGKLNIVAMETTTRQKIWSKSVSLPQEGVAVATEAGYTNTGVIPLGDPGVYNPIVRTLSEFYKSTLGQIYAYMEPQEMLTLKDQINQIRKNSSNMTK